MPRPGFTKIELMQQLGQAFRVSQNRSVQIDELVAQRLKVNLTDLRALDIVERLGRPTAGVLAAEMGLTTGAITAVVDRLVIAGLLERVRDDEDRRRVHLTLTPRARTEIDAVWGPLKEAYVAMMRGYTNEELALIIRFMRAGDVLSDELIDRLRTEDGVG